MRAATVVQQLCKFCRTCFKFYCMFYFTFDGSLTPWINKLLSQSRCNNEATGQQTAQWSVLVQMMLNYDLSASSSDHCDNSPRPLTSQSPCPARADWYSPSRSSTRHGASLYRQWAVARLARWNSHPGSVRRQFVALIGSVSKKERNGVLKKAMVCCDQFADCNASTRLFAFAHKTFKPTLTILCLIFGKKWLNTVFLFY